MVQESEILQIDPPVGVESFFNGKASKLWCAGEQGLLRGSLLGIISAREMDSDLAAKSSELLKRLASLKEVAFVGGWHSPLEKKALDILAANSAPVIFCLAKGLQWFVPPAEIASRARHGQALLLTHCSPKAKRISREASLRRNQLVMALARAVLVLSAPEGSTSLELATSALHYGKPVLTLEDRLNERLLECGALPASLANIQKNLR